MRLDKFLKVSRLIKRRTVAKEVAEKGRIEVNGVVAKPGTNVKVGDELKIRFGQKTVIAKIEHLGENARKEVAAEMYSIVSEERNHDQA
ncbi:RNA-binding S4 domain-containing protein [Listeria sp. PSOL-1]|uniref:RNA-binding S4 domain-containing protein n=1 Tax=Listeria sp. PSOL-1 TaxID=1844999 RepID=UPI00272E1055|nr:RNA-binding S4 domain-containing protein [Listeria sp. PSOL-1]